MKLLFDQTLSPKLVHSTTDLYPGSAHVRDLGLSRATDAQIWEYARIHEFAIVTKDSDFPERALVSGPPPKVIWIQLGNCATDEVLRLLRARHETLASVMDREDSDLLAIR